jgi:hypothetical protein
MAFAGQCSPEAYRWISVQYHNAVFNNIKFTNSAVNATDVY